MPKITIEITPRQIEVLYNCLPFALLPWEDDNGKKRPSEFTEDEVEELGDLLENLLGDDSFGKTT